MKKHIGKLANTDQRCVVAYMQLPGREDAALVICTDALPPRFEQAVMEIVDSNEGQSERDLANVLGRRLMPDTGKSVLQTLHERQMLSAVPVDKVIMLPRPNMPFPLVDLIREMAKLPDAKATTTPSMDAMQAPVARFDPHAVNRAAVGHEESYAIARNLIMEAEDLETAAKAKREKAYNYAPQLRAQGSNDASNAASKTTLVEAPQGTAFATPVRQQKKTKPKPNVPAKPKPKAKVQKLAPKLTIVPPVDPRD